MQRTKGIIAKGATPHDSPQDTKTKGVGNYDVAEEPILD